MVGLVALHAGDRYALYATSSVWIGLAEAASRGVLYPPLFEDGFVGGTRYMPLPVVLHAAVHALTGEFLVSARIVGLASMAVLAATMLAILRPMGVAMPLALGIVAASLTTEVGIVTVAGIRPEAIPVALELLAIALVARGDARPTRRTLAVAALLSVLAILAKFTAVVAPVAIVAWLLTRDRRGAVLFGGAVAALLVLALGALQVGTDGRFLENLRALGAVPPTLGTIATVPASILSALARSHTPFLLVPFAIGSYLVARGWRSLTIYQIALAVAVAVLLVVYTDLGASYNHLLEVLVLVAIVAAGAWHAPVGLPGRSQVASLLAVAVVVGGTATFVTGPGIDAALAARQALVRQAPMYDPAILDPYVRGVGPVLADDAWVPISVGQRPIVLDWYALYRLSEDHPEWLAALADRIRAREFGAIVLEYDIDDPERRVPDQSGPVIPMAAIDAAIRSAYRHVATVRTPSLSYALATPLYYVYHPR